jgi:hypothetical protein
MRSSRDRTFLFTVFLLDRLQRVAAECVPRTAARALCFGKLAGNFRASERKTGGLGSRYNFQSKRVVEVDSLGQDACRCPRLTATVELLRPGLAAALDRTVVCMHCIARLEKWDALIKSERGTA